MNHCYQIHLKISIILTKNYLLNILKIEITSIMDVPGGLNHQEGAESAFGGPLQLRTVAGPGPRKGPSNSVSVSGGTQGLTTKRQGEPERSTGRSQGPDLVQGQAAVEESDQSDQPTDY